MNQVPTVVREISRMTRRRYSAEEKIRIVLEGLKSEESIAELCRRQEISPNLYYNCHFTPWCGGPARRPGPAKAGPPRALTPNGGESVSKCGDDPNRRRSEPDRKQ
jgi:transposase-like protein